VNGFVFKRSNGCHEHFNNTMKKSICLLLLIAVAHLATGQDQDSARIAQEKVLKKMLTMNIKLDLDTSLFYRQGNNTYVAHKEKMAAIFVMAVPGDFEKGGNVFKKAREKPGYVTIEKADYTANGKRILYEGGKVIADNDDLNFDMFFIEGQDKWSIFVMATYKPGRKDIYKRKIKEGVETAVFVE